MPRQGRRHQLYLGAVWLMPLAVLSQIGLALFGVPLVIHAVLGVMIGLLAVLLVRLVFTARASRSQRILAIALVGLLGLQPCLIALRSVVPEVILAHQVNAFVILGIACALALDTEEMQVSTDVRSKEAIR